MTGRLAGVTAEVGHGFQGIELNGALSVQVTGNFNHKKHKSVIVAISREKTFQ